MRKVLSFLLSCLIAVSMVFPFSISASAQNTDPYINDSGYSSTDLGITEEQMTGLRQAIEKTITSFESSCNIASLNIPYSSELKSWLSAELWDAYPRFYGISGCTFSHSNGIMSLLAFTYQYSKEESLKRVSAIEQAADVLLDGMIGSDLTDAEKALLLHDRLVTWCEYDYDNYLNDTVPTDSFYEYGALVNRIAVCNGYSYAYKYLLGKVGVESELCSSDALDHAWNIVYIDGVPYHVDATWNDPVHDITGRVSHQNFLVSSDTLYANEHVAEDYSTLPQSDLYDNYFWQDSRAAFVLLNGKIYGIVSYADHDAIVLWENGTVTQIAALDYSYYRSLATDGSYLYYSSGDSIYQYDVTSGNTLKAYSTADSGYSNQSILGFRMQDNHFYIEINASAELLDYPYTPAYAPGPYLVNIGGKLYYVEGGAINTSVNGLKTVGSEKYLFENGIVNISFTGLHKHGDGKLYYIVNGKFNPYNGLKTIPSGEKYLFKGGIVNTSFTGLHKHGDGKLYYIVAGKFNSMSGLKTVDGVKYLLKGGILNTSFTGYHTHGDGKQYYMVNGVAMTGLQTVDGETYLFENGLVKTSFAGVYQHSDGKRYYIVWGKFNPYNGLKTMPNGEKYLLSGGVVSADFTGLHQHGDGKKYYIVNGKFSAYNGLKTINGIKYVLKSGILDTSVSGYYDYVDGKSYYVLNGVAVNGLNVAPDGKKYLYDNGLVKTSFLGVHQHSDGKYYYIAWGSFNSMTGLKTIRGTTYLLKGGIWDNTYNGTYTQGGVTYTIVNGLVA